MKKIIYSLTFICAVIFTTSCDDSVSDEFDDANGNIEVKLMKSIFVTSNQSGEENQNIEFFYNSNGSLNSISDGEDATVFVYSDSELSSVTGGETNLNIEELYDSPYDAFNTGEVVDYDDNGNPKTIEFIQEEYDFTTDEINTMVYTAELSYDSVHNPYFFTLEAGGIIEVLDNVQLNFSMNPQVPEIVQARLLFPVNNPSQIVYKNEEGQIMYTINVNYNYDSEDYPTTATVVAFSAEESQQSTYNVVYQYEE